MKQPIYKSAPFKRRLTLSRGLRQQDHRNVETGPDVEVVAYKTLESLGTEQRIQVRIGDEPFLDIHYTDRGWLCVEVQGMQAFDMRVKLTALEGQLVANTGGDDYTISI